MTKSQWRRPRTARLSLQDESAERHRNWSLVHWSLVIPSGEGDGLSGFHEDRLVDEQRRQDQHRGGGGGQGGAAGPGARPQEAQQGQDGAPAHPAAPKSSRQ